MTELPSGTVTFLFSDLEGSTRLWEEHPEAMQPALTRHDEILRAAISDHGGALVKGTGDGVHGAFSTADDAVAAAVTIQRALGVTEFDVVGTLRVRIGLHTGTAELRDGDYYGSSVNRAARIMSAAHGGQVVVSHVTEELVRESLPEGCALIDLGEHQLRDLSRTERVFQLSAPELLSDFPPLRSIDVLPGNVPLQLTSFVGREDELRSIMKTLDRTRLVTLTGVGGVGKTRLAVQVASDVLPRFPDGSWFCELAAASGEDSTAQVVASTLGVNPRPGTTLVGSIIEFLAAKRLLLVLDNCEHVLSTAARLAEGILRNCPGVRLLATSREGLGIEGERIWALRSLPVPDRTAAVTTIEACDAIRLFVVRAVDADADFAINASNRDSIVEICRRLDGIPLAIELAAARTASMNPREITDRLDERFRLLTGGRRTAVERHQTLRATVDWSYSMLGVREQTVFDRLGVFAGSFDSAAAEAVATSDDVERWDVVDALADLVAKSMLVAERTTDSTRYQLLETMRAFARERLDAAGTGDSWRARHAEHYASFAEAAGPGMVGPDEFVWRPRLYRELDNLRAAVTWSLDRPTGSDAEYALRITAALSYLTMQHRASGVGAWAELAIERARDAAPVYRAPVLAAAAESARSRGDHDAARALATEAIRAGVVEGRPEVALAYVVLSIVEATSGDLTRASDLIREGIAATEAAAGDDSFTGPALHNIEGIWANFAGDHDRARRSAETALEYARRVGNPTMTAIALFGFGNQAEHDDPATALASYDESIALVQAGASTPAYTATLNASSRLLARAGHIDAALARVRDAIERDVFEGDAPALLESVTVTAVILEGLAPPDVIATLAGIVTQGRFADLGAAIIRERTGFNDELIERLRAELVETAYDDAAARGGMFDFESIAEFALSTLDDAVRARHRA